MKKKENKITNKIKMYNIYFILIFITILFMSVVYAAINSIELDVVTNVEIKTQEEVFITDVSFSESIGTNASDSTIYHFPQTLLNSQIVLSETLNTSSITYNITVYNSTDSYYIYKGELYNVGSEFYSNADIEVKVEGISKGDLIAGKSYKTFKVTFSYLDNVLPDTTKENYNVLNSHINFAFAKATRYSLNNSAAVPLKKALTSGTLSAQNIGAKQITGTIGDNFKIVSGQGIYYKYTGSYMWIFFTFVKDDGYTSSLNTGHVYYTRCENKITANPNQEGTFGFGLSNAYHLVDGEVKRYGRSTALYTRTGTISDDYQVVSTHGKLAKSGNNTQHPSDYADTLQMGVQDVAQGLTFYVKNVMVMDLSTIFGVGNEPPKDWCDTNIGYDTEYVYWF